MYQIYRFSIQNIVSVLFWNSNTWQQMKDMSMAAIKCERNSVKCLLLLFLFFIYWFTHLLIYYKGSLESIQIMNSER